MCPLHNPVPRPVTWNLLPRRGFPSGWYVDGVSLILKQLADFREVVAFIGAHVLRSSTFRFRLLDDDALQGWLCQLHVMPIGASDGKGDGYAVAFD